MYSTSRLISSVQVTITQISLIIRYKVGTAYEGGIFRCKLVVDSEFPQKPPKGKSKILFETLTVEIFIAQNLERIIFNAENFKLKWL